MKILVVAVVLLGTCYGQGPHQGRRYQQNDQDDNQNYHQQQGNQQNYQPQQQQQQQQQYEHRPNGHESTTFIPIIRFDKEQGIDGTYKSLWETGNHILVQEQGYLKDLGPDPDNKDQQLKGQVQEGSFKYTAPNGEEISATYRADETGFHIFGDHLPTPPPPGPEVQKGLDIIFAAIKQQQEQGDGEYQQEGKNPNQIEQEPPNYPYRQEQRQHKHYQPSQ